MTEDLKDFITINDIHYNLTNLELLAWQKLLNGYVKKKNGFRNMVVGTSSELGAAALRTVVNRKVDIERKIIYFHTDARSRKFQDLKQNPQISLLFYDPRQRIQIVLKATAKFHINDPLANNRWQSTSPQARLSYMTIEPPNTRSEAPTLGYETRFSETKPTAAESGLYQSNFAVIACEVEVLEFLHLNNTGNRKANFYYKNGELMDCFWAVP